MHALVADRALAILHRANSRQNRDWQEETFSDKAPKVPIKSIILSRVIGRLEHYELATFYGVILDVASNEFNYFASPKGHEEVSYDETVMVKALDFKASENQKILGEGLNLIEVLPPALRNIQTALSTSSFSEASQAAAADIASARADAVNGFQIALSMYEGLRWVYGDGAFGLRFINWIAQRAPDAVVDGMTLAMLRLRAVPDAILSSQQIAALALQAREMEILSKRIEGIWRNNPHFKEVFTPKRIRDAFADEFSMKRWIEAVNAARIHSQK
ncbi:MAG: hypothetical protein JWM36_2620 [Hyphomicrobiales bacterium]|nr:hypothetical protein [Hyphomicrobiales bacterium]